MQIDFDDLFCEDCHSYVHLLLEHCPACGSGRPSRYEAALAAPESLSPSTTSPGMLHAAGIAMRRHMLTSRGRGVGTTEPDVDPELGLDLGELFNRIARVLKYRATGAAASDARRAGTGTGADVAVRAAGSHLRLEALADRRVVGALELARVLSITPVARAGRGLPRWVGIATAGATAAARPSEPLPDVLVLHATDFGITQLGIGNRSGLFVSTARPDHYEEIARWLGALAALEAGRRAQEIGVEAYAAELGLTPPPSQARAGTPDRPSTATALRELDELRAAGLVTETEFERKRGEILDRL